MLKGSPGKESTVDFNSFKIDASSASGISCISYENELHAGTVI